MQDLEFAYNVEPAWYRLCEREKECEREKDYERETERDTERDTEREELVATCMQWCRQPSGTQATTAGQPRPLLPLPAPWARA